MGFGDDVVGDYPFLLLLFSPWYEARYLNVRTILRSMMVLDCSGGMLPKEPGRSCVFADVGGQALVEYVHTGETARVLQVRTGIIWPDTHCHYRGKHMSSIYGCAFQKGNLVEH